MTKGVYHPLNDVLKRDISVSGRKIQQAARIARYPWAKPGKPGEKPVSRCRGYASSGSDIDILISFNRPVGVFEFLELEERLSEWLGAKVDLVTKAALKPHIGRCILSEVAMLW